MSLSRQVKASAGDLVRAVTRPVGRRLAIETCPGWLGRVHNVRVPRNTRRKPEAGPGGGANVKVIFGLLCEALAFDGDIAECGVFQGATLIPIGLYVQRRQLDKLVFGFDSFAGLDGSVAVDQALGGDDEDRKRVGGFSDTSYSSLVEKTRQFGLADVVRVVPGYFHESFPRHADRRFCFVHLDCVLYESYKQAMEFFYPRLVPGGVILLDEYRDPPWPGCTRAVDEFLADKLERPLSVSSDNQIKYYLRKR